MTQSLAFPALWKGKPTAKKSWRQSVGLYCLLQCGLALNISIIYCPPLPACFLWEMSVEGDETVEPVLCFHGALPCCRWIPHGREFISLPWEKPLPQHISCPALLLHSAEHSNWPGKACPPWGDRDGLELTSAVVSTSSPHITLANTWLAAFPTLLQGLWDEWHPGTLKYLHKHLVQHFLSTENQVSEHTACSEQVDEEVRVFLVLPALQKKNQLVW